MKTGRPSFKPTDKDRATVKAMLGYGITQAQVAKVLKIDIKTLAKHFPDEIDNAQVEANAAVAQSLFRMATKGNNVAAAIFWLKTRGQWKETNIIAGEGPNGAIIFQILTGVPRSDTDD